VRFRHGIVIAYDRSLPFTLISSWQAFNVGPLSATPTDVAGYMELVPVGRHLYFAPFMDGAAVSHARVLRFDLSCRIDDLSCYQFFSTGTFNGATVSVSAVAHNEFFYWARSRLSCRVSRYNTSLAMSVGAAYQVHSTCSTIFPGAATRTSKQIGIFTTVPLTRVQRSLPPLCARLATMCVRRLLVTPFDRTYDRFVC
jgi:hypothetical protein